MVHFYLKGAYSNFNHNAYRVIFTKFHSGEVYFFSVLICSIENSDLCVFAVNIISNMCLWISSLRYAVLSGLFHIKLFAVRTRFSKCRICLPLSLN